MRKSSSGGMSLIELMVVVVIIGILAAISVVSYRRYIAKARSSEATAMLAEFAAKEQLYFMDSGGYLEAHRDTAQGASTDENSSEFFPVDPNVPTFDSVRTPTDLGTLPNSWLILGIRPRWKQLFCTYMVNSGVAGAAPLGVIGPTIWTTPPNVPWFYALGACNLGGDAGWPNNVTVFILTHDSPSLRTKDEIE